MESIEYPCGYKFTTNKNIVAGLLTDCPLHGKNCYKREVREIKDITNYKKEERKNDILPYPKG